jgi:hypothetical protein
LIYGLSSYKVWSLTVLLKEERFARIHGPISYLNPNTGGNTTTTTHAQTA